MLRCSQPHVRAHWIYYPWLLTPFSHLKMLCATLYGWLLFGQLPNALSLTGTSIIVAGAGSLARSEGRWPRDHCGNTPNAA